MSRILLDTNVLIWTLGAPSRLTPQWTNLLADDSNDVFFSPVSVAEISIKTSVGKLTVPEDYLTTMAQSGFVELTLTAAHAHTLRTLPWHHRDPFDRLIISQALVEDLAVMTSDAAFALYGVALA
ncbi:MAG: type II toxin-antitoxin system VapC family toxin [Micrococcales bacterium]|nr:type II toxin-antitoxin system VapC family toxin [Micrococcales bacterium]